MHAELHCFNCARHLADVVRDDRGRVRLLPPAGAPDRPVLVTVRRTYPYCTRCGGRALLQAGIDTRIPRQRTETRPAVAITALVQDHPTTMRPAGARSTAA